MYCIHIEVYIPFVLTIIINHRYASPPFVLENIATCSCRAIFNTNKNSRKEAMVAFGQVVLF